jgi:hypothetical protein
MFGGKDLEANMRQLSDTSLEGFVVDMGGICAEDSRKPQAFKEMPGIRGPDEESASRAQESQGFPVDPNGILGI